MTSEGSIEARDDGRGLIRQGSIAKSYHPNSHSVGGNRRRVLHKLLVTSEPLGRFEICYGATYHFRRGLGQPSTRDIRADTKLKNELKSPSCLCFPRHIDTVA